MGYLYANVRQTATNLSEKAEAHMSLGPFEEATRLLDLAQPVLQEKSGPNHRLSWAATERRQRLMVSMDRVKENGSTPNPEKPGSDDASGLAADWLSRTGLAKRPERPPEIVCRG